MNNQTQQEEFDAWNAKADRFDGFDRGDLNNSYDDERDAKNEYEFSNQAKTW